MKLEINPRGNGACPLCRRLADCAIRRRLATAVADVSDTDGGGMEITVYACPSFAEQVRP